MTKTDLLIISPLQPLSSAVTEIASCLIEALSATYHLHCLMDTLSPKPTGLREEVSLVGIEVLADENHPLQKARRLYIIGNCEPSLTTLGYMVPTNALVVLVSPGLLKLQQLRIKEEGKWPDKYIDHLKSMKTPLGDTLANGLQVHKRYPDEINHHLYAFSQIPKMVTCVALSANAHNNYVTASRGHKFEQKCLPLIQPTWKEGDENSAQITIWCRDDELSGSATERSIRSLTNLGDDIEIVWLPVGEFPHKKTPDLKPTIIIDFTNPDQYSYGLLAQFALENAIPLITHQDGWAKDISGSKAIKLKSPDDEHALTAAVAALINENSLNTYYAGIDHKAGGHEQGWIDLINGLAIPNIPITVPDNTPVHLGENFYQEATAEIGTAKKAAMLIGSIPGRTIVKNAWPEIDTSLSAHFMTDETAHHLSRILRFPRQLLPQRFDNESPLITGVEQLNDLRSYLRGGDQIIIPPSPREPAIANNGKASIFQADLSFQPKGLNDFEDLRGFLPDLGLAWYLNHNRQQLDIAVLAAGISFIELKNRHPEFQMEVFDTLRNHHLDTHETFLVGKTWNNLIVFSLTLLDREKHKSVPLKTSLKAFEEHPLEVRWFKE